MPTLTTITKTKVRDYFPHNHKKARQYKKWLRTELAATVSLLQSGRFINNTNSHHSDEKEYHTHIHMSRIDIKNFHRKTYFVLE